MIILNVVLIFSAGIMAALGWMWLTLACVAAALATSLAGAWKRSQQAPPISTQIGRLRLVEKSLNKPIAPAVSTPPVVENRLKHRIASTENALGQVFLEVRRLEACLYELNDASINAQVCALSVAVESAKESSREGAGFYQVASEGFRLGQEGQALTVAALPILSQIQQSVLKANEHFISAATHQVHSPSNLLDALNLLKREVRLSRHSLKQLVGQHPKLASPVAPLTNGVIGLEVVLEGLLDAYRENTQISA